MKEKILIFILLHSPSLISSLSGNCDEATANKDYFDCRDKYKEGTTCSIITNIIDSCSSVLANCRSDEEVQDINADLIKANLAGQNTSLEDCEIVNKYRADGLLGNITRRNCTPEEDTQIKRDFHDCAYNVSNQLQPIKDTIPRETVNQVICDTLKNASDTCKGILNKCAVQAKNEEDLYNAQLENNKKFLQEMLNVTTDAPTLESCNIKPRVSILQAASDAINHIAGVYESTKEIEKALSGESESKEQMITVESAGNGLVLNKSLITLLPAIFKLFR